MSFFTTQSLPAHSNPYPNPTIPSNSIQFRTMRKNKQNKWIGRGPSDQIRSIPYYMYRRGSGDQMTHLWRIFYLVKPPCPFNDCLDFIFILFVSQLVKLVSPVTININMSHQSILLSFCLGNSFETNNFFRIKHFPTFFCHFPDFLLLQEALNGGANMMMPSPATTATPTAGELGIHTIPKGFGIAFL